MAIGTQSPAQTTTINAHRLSTLGTESVERHVRGTKVHQKPHETAQEQIQATFPCTPLQEEALAAEGPKSWTSMRLALPNVSFLSVDRVQFTWQAVSAHNPLLRTIFFKNSKDSRTWQAVLKTFSPLRFRPGETSDSEYAQESAYKKAPFITLQEDSATGGFIVTLHIHRALVDNASLALIKTDFALFYSGIPFPEHVPFSLYVAHLQAQERRPLAIDYWRNKLSGVANSPPPVSISPKEEIGKSRKSVSARSADDVLPRLQNFERKFGVTRAAILQAAWALVLWRHCDANSVVFSMVGRDQAFAGVQNVVGFLDAVFPLALNITRDMSVLDLMRSVQDTHLESSPHALIGYHEITRLANPELKSGSLVRYMQGLECPVRCSMDKEFPLTLFINESDNLCFTICHDAALSTVKVDTVLQHTISALNSIVRNPRLPVENIDLISPQEYDFILRKGASNHAPKPDIIHRLFEQQVKLRPNAPAVQFEMEETLTYNELNSIANRIARQLPCGPGEIVPLCMDRSTTLVASIIAILKRGAAYVTLDPDHPTSRLQFIVGDVDASFVLVQRQYADRFPSVRIAEDLINTTTVPESNLNIAVKPEDAAYIVYTSGSTGKPKGVVLEHGAATTGMAYFGGTPNVRALLFYNPVFSAAQRTILATLVKGGTLCLASKQSLQTSLSTVLNNMQVNSVGVTSSTAALLHPSELKSVKTMTLTGELIEPSLLETWADKLDLRNAYGLSECTQLNFGQRLFKDSNVRNVGRPIDNTSAYVLIPETLRLSPIGVAGELCLGGSQLGRGYLNRPEQTAKVFMENPFGPGRLYRTGDMAICHEDGSIEIIGRIDFQVKINGQRVELSEIGAVIKSHPEVEMTTVISATISERKTIVACIVPKNKDSAPPNNGWKILVEEVKKLVSSQLPAYMMPSFWYPMPNGIPRNSNGKIDVPTIRKQSEELGVEGLLQFSRGYSTPAEEIEWTEAELLIKKIWAKVLGLDEKIISPADSFLALGGSSLQAIMVRTQSREEGIIVEVGDIIQSPSLRDLATNITQVDPATLSAESNEPEPFELLNGIRPSKVEGIEDAYPVTPLQEAMLAATITGDLSYIYQRVFTIGGEIDVARLRSAFQSVVQLRPMLRTTFIESEGGGYLQAVKSELAVPFAESNSEIQEFMKKDKESSVSFGGAFFRVTLLQQKYIVVTTHHALFDYWSHRFLYQDVAAAYFGNTPVARPTFKRFVKHLLINQKEEDTKNFWSGYLSNAEPTLLNILQPAESHSVAKPIPENLAKFCASNNITVGATIYAAWALALAVHTGNTSDITFATTLSGRDAPLDNIQALDGPTLTTVPQRIAVDAGSKLLDFVKLVQGGLWDLARNSQFGMRKALQVSGHRGTAGLFDTLVNILVNTDSAEETDVNSIFVPYGKRPVWGNEYTTLEFEEHKTKESLLRLTSACLGKERTEFVLGHVLKILTDICTAPDMLVSQLSLVNEQEQAYLLSLSPRKPSETMFLHARMENWAKIDGDRIAIQFEHSEFVSYRELNARANRLASFLVNEKGFKVGDFAPLLLDKSVNTMVCILGVMKAGGAYVPLSPDNPAERNIFIAQEVNARVVLTQTAHTSMFETAQDTIECVCMDTLDLSEYNSENFSIPNHTPSNTAYAIYTSGSTGKPKGVVMPHAPAASAVESMLEVEGRHHGEWRTLQFANYVFDASVQDIFNTLSSGGTLCMAPTETLLADLPAAINSMNVKQIILTPTVAKLMSPDQVPCLEVMILGGEPMTADVIENWTKTTKLLNVYGPTETAMVVTTMDVQPHGNPRIIGKAFPTVTGYIVNRDSTALVPYGAIGELCFSGDQLSQGYINRPDVTSAAFVTNSFGERMYRTGDLARFLPGGEIECFGRKDNQVKINGHRVELGEIEQGVLSTGKVKDCAVIAASIRGKNQLAAFVVFDPTSEESIVAPEVYAAAVQDLHASLTMLTPYMIPKLWLPCGAFPKLPSRKTDRKRLVQWVQEMDSSLVREYSVSHSTGGEIIPVESEQEKLLQTLWARLMDVEAESIGSNTSFLSLGGDSIVAINLVSQARRAGFRLVVGDVLALPTLGELATTMKKIEQTGDLSKMKFDVKPEVYETLEAAGIPKSSIQEIYPAAPGQVEFMAQAKKDAQFWNLMTVRRIPKDLDFDKWTQITTKLTEINTILRTSYIEDPTHGWLQIVLKDAVLDLEVIECENQEEGKKAAIKSIWERRFEVTKPFVRYRLLSYPDGERDIVIKIDHGSYDGTLLRIFDDQFTALAQGKTLPKHVEFKDFSMLMNSSNKKQALDYWTDLMAGNDFLYPPVEQPIATGVTMVETKIKLDEFASEVGVTVPIIFQTAVAFQLHKLTSRNDIAFDNLITGRNVDMEDAQLINGNCANFLPFRSQFKEDTTVKSMLKDAQGLFWKATEYGHIGLDEIARATGTTEKNSKVLFLFQPFEPAAPGGKVNHMRWLVMAMSQVTMYQPYAMIVEVSKALEGHKVKVYFDETFHTAESAKKLGNDVVDMAELMMKNGDSLVSSLCL